MRSDRTGLEILGQPIIIDNKPGGGQIIGSDLVAKSKADGYTLLGAGVPIAFNTALGRKRPYDAVKDFTPISEVVSQPLLIVVNPALPAKNMQELLAYAKRQPSPLQYTTGGIGSYGHLWWEMFRLRQGVEGQHVAYNGIAPALKDVIGGTCRCSSTPSCPPVRRSTRARSAGSRSLAVPAHAMPPELATLSEQGYAGFDAAPFYGVLAPANLDPAIATKLSSTLTQALAVPALREKLQEQGFDIIASSPQVYAKLIRDEIDRWSKVVKDAGIAVE